MASVVTSIKSIDQFNEIAGALANTFGLDALTWGQAAFDRVNDQTPSGFNYTSNTKVSMWYSNGDKATVYGSNLMGSISNISKLDYQFADGTSASLEGNVTHPTSGSPRGEITQITVSKTGKGTTTLYGRSDVSTGDIFVSKEVTNIGNVHYEENSSTTGYVWINKGNYQLSYEADISYAAISTPGQFLEMSDLSYKTNSQIYFKDAESIIRSVLSGNDTITSIGTNAILFGSSGNNLFNGGTSIDTILYDNPRANYTISQIADGYMVTSNDGIDTLNNIERLQFHDIKIALDLSPIDGKAAQVAKIIGAVFGAESVANKEYVGIGLHHLDKGMTYSELIEFALEARLGNGYSNTDEVILLYSNLVGENPPIDDLNYYVNAITSGQFTQTTLAIMAADLELNTANIDLIGLAQTGLEYS